MHELDAEIVACRRCPRLIEHCRREAETKRAAFRDWDYWGKPVPNFGSYGASIMIVGLAPGAHGANRTGRMFTGDPSADFLAQVLHRTGLANQSTSTHIDDGFQLDGALITAVAHCAPPANKLTADERDNCASHLASLFRQMRNLRVVVALGGEGWRACISFAREQGWWADKQPRFAHGAEAELTNGALVLASYHPSPHNTYTKRLTQPMMAQVFKRAIKRAKA